MFTLFKRWTAPTNTNADRIQAVRTVQLDQDSSERYLFCKFPGSVLTVTAVPPPKDPNDHALYFQYITRRAWRPLLGDNAIPWELDGKRPEDFLWDFLIESGLEDELRKKGFRKPTIENPWRWHAWDTDPIVPFFP